VTSRVHHGDDPARRVPHIPLPSSTFVSGQSTRPPENWWASVDAAEWFDFGCDLFDAGFYFEAHELWEQCWRAAKDVGNDDDASFVQGLILMAAAGVKLLAGNDESRHAHLSRAAARLIDQPPRRGLRSDALREALMALRRRRRPRLS
jgi:predicted metal-dependent hydrolase